MTGAKTTIRPLVAGNWKMNGSKAALGEAKRVADGLFRGAGAGNADVMLCPPAPLISGMVEALHGTRISVGGQDCHVKTSGAHTGDVAAEMLADAGAVAVIVGHSERRSDHGETSKIVRAKASAAHRAGLIAIVCIGETAGERRSDLTLAVVARQLEASLPESSTAANTIVAYEPVWAIGTGLTPTAGDVRDVHAAIRDGLSARFGAEGAAIRILYGGSVKPDNAQDLMGVDNVNGALVGGASLKADDFLGIIKAYG